MNDTVIIAALAIILFIIRLFAQSEQEPRLLGSRRFLSRREIYNFGDLKTYDILLFAVIILISWFSFLLALIAIPIAIMLHFVFEAFTKDSEITRMRKNALLKSKIFLLPYKDIWRNLTLSNKYCTLRLLKDGVTIIGLEKKTDQSLPCRTFRVTNTAVFDSRELWNLLCTSFTYNTHYESLLEACERYRATVYEDTVTSEFPVKPTKSKAKTKTVQPETEVKIDINNSSEAELTALPGINIVIAKKIIKKREEIGGFKNVDEFLKFIKLSPNLTKQLSPKICVRKKEGSLKITKNRERTIDL